MEGHGLVPEGPNQNVVARVTSLVASSKVDVNVEHPASRSELDSHVNMVVLGRH